ncbi:hypothetical protein [uncultured Porphyromonas sp.]|uniref:hypothetical protein n=2 Tax=uncultured Porphyromonas sp. TaxID=159274 RepID=UPI0005E70658|nr:hypothetical protein [uncultured Porphyromonas sp.]CQB86224.1 Uncharacterised protein [Chlamydia trachomatis]
MKKTRYIHWPMPPAIIAVFGALLIACATQAEAQQGAYSFPSYSADVSSRALAGNLSLQSQMPLYSLPTTSLHQMKRYYATYSVLGLSHGTPRESSALHSLALGYRLHKGLDLSIGTRILRGEQVEITNHLGAQVGSFRPTEATVDLAIAKSFTPKLDAYLRASYLYSNVGVKAHGVAASLGATYYHSFQVPNGVTLHGAITAALHNVGPKLTYHRAIASEETSAKSRVALPSELSLQAHLHTTLREDHTIGIGVRTGYFYHLHPYYGLNASAGAEYLWKKLVAIQVGIGLLQRQPLYSVGVGAEYQTISLHLAYTHTTQPNSLGGVHLGLAHRF